MHYLPYLCSHYLPCPGSSCTISRTCVATISRTRVAHYLPYPCSPLSPVPGEPTISRTRGAHYLPYPCSPLSPIPGEPTISRTRVAHYLPYPGSPLSPVPGELMHYPPYLCSHYLPYPGSSCTISRTRVFYTDANRGYFLCEMKSLVKYHKDR